MLIHKDIFYQCFICFTLYNFMVTLYNELKCMSLASSLCKLSRVYSSLKWYCHLNMIWCALPENLGCNAKGSDPFDAWLYASSMLVYSPHHCSILYTYMYITVLHALGRGWLPAWFSVAGAPILMSEFGRYRMQPLPLMRCTCQRFTVNEVESNDVTN